MLLTIDVGNTNTVLGVFRGDELAAAKENLTKFFARWEELEAIRLASEAAKAG